jgi:hypothetical protein
MIKRRTKMNFFANSIPKSGTNLLQKLLDLSSVPYSGRSIAASSSFGKFGSLKQWFHRPKANETPLPIGLEVPTVVSPAWLKKYLNTAHGYVTGHAQHTAHLSHLLASENYKTIQIFRHPCAVLVSWAYYIERPGYYWNEASQKMAKVPLQDRMILMAKGGLLGNIYYTGLAEVIRKAEGWLQDGNTLVVRFEDLVGSLGGGNNAVQKNTIKTILKFAGLKKSDADIALLQSSLFGQTRTFRNGQVDGWKSTMSPQTLKLMQGIFGEMSFSQQLNYNFNVCENQSWMEIGRP